MRNFTFMKSSGKSLLLILFFTLMSLNVFAEGTTSVSHNLVNITALCSVSDLTSAPAFNVAEDNLEKRTISINAFPNLYDNNQTSDIVKQNNVVLEINFKRSNILNKKVFSPVFFLNQNGDTFFSQSYLMLNVECSKFKAATLFSINPNKILVNQFSLDFHRLFFCKYNEKYAEADNRINFSNVFYKHYLFIDPECLVRDTNTYSIVRNYDYQIVGNSERTQTNGTDNCGTDAVASQILTRPAGATVVKAYVHWYGMVRNTFNGKPPHQALISNVMS